MEIYPAIDLKEGRCVRLVRGAMASATVFNDDPADQARQFASAGFRWLHLVDLDGAFAGRSVNEAAVTAVLDAVSLPVQLGGGIRDEAAIDGWLSRGVRRVILGTSAVRDPALVKRAARRHPGGVVVGIDARAGQVVVEGWAEGSEMAAVDLARAFEDAGVAAIVYTDIDRDGTLGGPNVEATAALARAVTIPVIASGGVGSVEHLHAVKQAGVIAGAIVGRALYDGRVTAAEALSLC